MASSSPWTSSIRIRESAACPYRTTHLNRLGHYTLDVTRVPLPLEYDLPIFTTGSQ